MKRYLLIVIFGAVVISTSAQTNLTMQGSGVVQTMALNPALAPNKDFLSIPLLGSFNVAARAPFSYNDVITKVNGVKYLDTRRLVNQLSKSGDITSVNFNLDLVNAGFYVSPDDFIGISLSTRLHFASNLPEGMFEMLLDNPLSDINRTFNISASPNVLGWNEFGISYSRAINRNFRVGVRLKYLMGMASVQSDGVNFTMQKSFNGYKLSGDLAINGGNLNFANTDFNSTFSNFFRNSGVAADLGLEFVSNDRHIMAMASVSDLGAIFWNAESSSKIVAKNPGKVFEFNGFGKLQGLLDGNLDVANLTDSVWNSLTETIGVDTLSGQFVKTMTPVRYHAMVEYAIDPYFCHNVSLAFLGTQPYKRGFDYAISAGYTYRPRSGRWQLMANYTYKPNIPVGVGIGAAYTSRKFQLFLAFDDIVPLFNVKGAKGTGFQLGLNILL